MKWNKLAAAVGGLAVVSIVVLALVKGAKIVSHPNSRNVISGTVVDRTTPLPEGLMRATFGAGCFWCTEAVFQQVKGVHGVVSGYSGGHVPNPTYRQVCGGDTGHAEVIQITFDPQVVSFAELLEVFWQTHDPTTLNRQGGDHGTQYRSVVFYHDDDQRTVAEEYKRQLDATGAFHAPIVTEISPFTTFYPAEDYHQNYYLDNGNQPYCAVVVRPKVEKFRKQFQAKLKDAR